MSDALETEKEQKEEAIALEADPYVIRTVEKDTVKVPVWAKVCIFIPVFILAIYLGGVLFFSNHFSWNTSLNGVDVSFMTAAQAQQAIEAMIQNYQLEIRERDGETEYIKGTDIDLEFQLLQTISDVLKQQNVFLWFLPDMQPRAAVIETEVSYDLSKLYQQIHALDCMQKENMIQPVEPQIVKQSGVFIVKEGIEGRKPLGVSVQTTIRNGITNLVAYVDLEANDCYATLQYDAADPVVLEALDYMNQIKDIRVTYQFEEETEILKGEDIQDWILLSKDYEVSIDRKAVEEYIEYLKETYEIKGQVIQFHTSYKQTVEVRSYIPSNELNTTVETDQLIEAIESLSDSGKKTWVRTALDMASVGDTYIEINLTSQHLYCYKDGIMILETDIVSGKPSTGCATPPGVYRIRSKSSPAILVGETYRTPVSYWMPFNRGIGLHDATWQSAYGGSRYITHGSHGCINLPLDVAKFIYENYEAGDCVVLYHLEGTESGTASPAGRASSSPVYVQTESVTEAITEAPTESATENVTEGSTEGATEASTEITTEASTEATTETTEEISTEDTIDGN